MSEKTLQDVLSGLNLIEDVKKIKEDVYQRVMTKMAPDEIRKRILMLKMVVDVSYFEMGGYLYWVQKKGYWKAWGYNSWTDYVEREVGFSLRKVEYLQKIWYWIDSMEVPIEKKKELVALGWDKTKEVAGIVDSKNIDEIIKMGDKSSLEFKAEVKRKFKQQPNVGTQQRFHVYLWEDQHATVLDAIEKAKELGNTDRIGHALSLICLSWLAENMDLKDWRESVARTCIKMEQVLGLKMLIVDKEENLVYKTKGFGE